MQLRNLFHGFTGDKYQTALFMALAHEFGHICQFRVLGVDETFRRERIEVEAHADVISGVWLGVRLYQCFPRLPDDVMDAGLCLKKHTVDYPTAYQRGCLLQKGMGDAAMICQIDENMTIANYAKLRSLLTDRDVQDLFNIAKTVLEQTPEQKP